MMQYNMKIFQELYDYIKDIEIIDTHEHLPSHEEKRDKNTDVIKEYLLHYFNRDIVSAGLSRESFSTVVDVEKPLMERWKIVEPYWNAARNTGYGRSLDIAARLLYGIERITSDTIEELNEKFLKSLNGGHYHKVLKEISKIKISILDSDLNCDKNYFKSVFRFDDFIFPRNLAGVHEIEQCTGTRIYSMGDWLEAAEIMLDKVISSGSRILKCGLAYVRTLKFDRVSGNDAENDFNQIFKSKHTPEWEYDSVNVGKSFQDYMMHFILRIAAKKNMTYQFHTGLQEGKGNVLLNAEPSLLSNLFLEYPEVDFDLFHISYPFQNIAAALAKNFYNVYLDMCWAHIISPSVSVDTLIQWLDSVPVNKISAFGGDYLFIDGVAGHQYLARQNVAKALSIKVQEGAFDMDMAIKASKMLFYDNPERIFKLNF